MKAIRAYNIQNELNPHLQLVGVASSEILGSTKSYDVMCIVPRRSLLKTVIPGWLWSGITAVGGKKNIHICVNRRACKGNNCKRTEIGFKLI